jgi:hypothetical protein
MVFVEPQRRWSYHSESKVGESEEQLPEKRYAMMYDDGSLAKTNADADADADCWKYYTEYMSLISFSSSSSGSFRRCKCQ